MHLPFQRLIRFTDSQGHTVYGDLPLDVHTDEIEGSSVEVLAGDIHAGFMRTSNQATMKVPKFPVIFTKPPDALAGPFEDVHVHPEIQKQMDYEGELTVVIGKDAKNVTEEDALDYVLGYTCGNDFSARDFQVPADVVGTQYCYAKSFDQFGPIGPAITAAPLIPNPQALTYETRVNGEVKQRTSTEDMIWSVRQIIAHLTRGTTLRKGTCIMTGTPSGVGLWMKPPVFLKSEDVIEVDVEKIGILRNKVVFDK